MKNMVLLNVVMMMVILFIKVMNATMKMMIDIVELMNEMIRIIRRNNNNGNMIGLLLIVLMTKVLDVMVDNTVAFAIDVIRIVAKFVNVVEWMEIAEFVFVLIAMVISYITDFMTTNIVFSNTVVFVIAITMISVLNVLMAITTLNLKVFRRNGLHDETAFQYSCVSIPLC